MLCNYFRRYKYQFLGWEKFRFSYFKRWKIRNWAVFWLSKEKGTLWIDWEKLGSAESMALLLLWLTLRIRKMSTWSMLVSHRESIIIRGGNNLLSFQLFTSAFKISPIHQNSSMYWLKCISRKNMILNNCIMKKVLKCLNNKSDWLFSNMNIVEKIIWKIINV